MYKATNSSVFVLNRLIYYASGDWEITLEYYIKKKATTT